MLREVSDEPEEVTMPSLPPPTAIQPSTAVFVPIYDTNWSSRFEDYQDAVAMNSIWPRLRKQGI
jgi:hypothetical protein